MAHPPRGTIPCIWCSETFTNKISLANHYDNVHKQQPSGTPSKLDEILDKAMYKQDFWTKEVKREISDVEAKAEIKALFKELIGARKPVRQYERPGFGHGAAAGYNDGIDDYEAELLEAVEGL